nr:GNAT family N-acetyltransferase [uncultured Mucilaginibacter sp.]
MQPANDPQLIVFNALNFSLIDDLAAESKQQGYLFVQRAIDEWNSGENTFSGDGEQLFGLVAETKLVGIGGLNRDPYTHDLKVGRVRHLYIRDAYRRKGYATVLMNTIIDAGKHHFDTLRLFTDNPAASEFYTTLGFQKVNGQKVSHVLNLQKDRR